MNATSIPRTGTTFSGYYSASKGSDAAITLVGPTQELQRKDSFHLPPGILRGIGTATVMLCATWSSGAMHGLTPDGLREALSRNRAQLVRSSVDPEELVQANQRAESRTVGEQLREIRQAFGLNATDMSLLFGIARPTVYAWMDGQEPRPDAASRILALVKLADEFAALGLRRPDTLVKRPLFENSQSLFDLLQQGIDVRMHFDTLRALDAKEAASRAKTKGSGELTRSFEDAATDSTPLTFE
ncbi:MAG: hypothetical protein HYX62_04700 [Gammaproteobacteria bacterium]|nr:hypothetical protein [Gammaproteobacteria bacterium]